MTEKTDNVCYRPSKTMLVALFCVLAGVLFVPAIPTAWATPSEAPAQTIPPCPSQTIPVTGVRIDGPTWVALNFTYAFTAVISPPDATSPIGYTWFPVPASGQDTANARYTWTTLGRKMILVTAINPLNPWVCGVASASHEIVVAENYYMPVVIK